MKINKFEDILSWQKSQILNTTVFKLFESNRDYDFVKQIRRASVSISNNIAEGFERQSNNEFKYFLFVAKGSCGEVRSMLYLAKSLEYIDNTTFQNLYKETIEISKLISGLIKTL
ncbi:MAG TPA: four helix bundle protein [Candidatus Absconditabacterales bacterium]|nr:four helix bundle protein [Candidatus Absconditabacterales bacterium]